MMEALIALEPSDSFNLTARRNIPEDNQLQHLFDFDHVSVESDGQVCQ
jgi:hypothetical protein